MEIKFYLLVGAEMSKIIKNINNFFKKAVKQDIDNKNILKKSITFTA